MKGPLSTIFSLAAVATAITAHAGISGGGASAAVQEPKLLLVGPVEAIDVKHSTAIVLGQTVLVHQTEGLTIGETVEVFGTTRPDGVFAASAVKSEGLYVPGSTGILLSAPVQKLEPSVGRAIIGGLNVDLTALMAAGAVSPEVGAVVQVNGTQPALHGLVLANGISGGGVSIKGISGGGSYGISGGGSSATGVSIKGISGGGSYGISGGGSSASIKGISGGGSYGISGGGSSATGVSIKGISGGGSYGISGGGSSATGVSIKGISGGGSYGISGGGSQ